MAGTTSRAERTRLAAALAATLCCAPALAAPTVRVADPAGAWTTAQLSLIERAAVVALERLPSTEVARCALREAWRGKPSKERWEKDMARLRRLDKVELLVRPVTGRGLGDGVRGTAKVGTADLRDGALTGLEIALASDKITGEQRPEDFDVGSWANTIAHEIGHTLGFSHATGGLDWEADYAGFFVTELGYCVASQGRYGSGRDDPALRRERKRRFGKVVP